MSKYRLKLWVCSDECYCKHFEIYGPRPEDGREDRLWSGRWWNDCLSPEEMEKVRQELVAAADRLGLKVDTSGETYWDWELIQ